MKINDRVRDAITGRPGTIIEINPDDIYVRVRFSESPRMTFWYHISNVVLPSQFTPRGV